MDEKFAFTAPGEHKYDPIKKDLDPVGFALDRVQTYLLWIEEHRASFEKVRFSDPETADSELDKLRQSTIEAMKYLQRLSEFILMETKLDPNKTLPKSLEAQTFAKHVNRILSTLDKYNADK